MFKKLQPYNKFIVALVGAVAQVAAEFYGDNYYVQLGLAFLTALGVYAVKNGKK